MPEARSLICPNCDQTVTAEYVNMAKLIAMCPNCNHVFQFESLFDAGTGSPKLKPPSSFDVDTTEDGVVMRYWRNRFITQQDWGVVGGLIGTGVGAFLTGFILLLTFQDVLGRPLWLVLTLLGFLATLYPIAGLLLNRVTLAADADSIRYSESPFPLFNRSIDAGSVSRAEVELDTMTQVNAAAYAGNEQFGIWRVMLERHGEGNAKLIGRLPKPAAQFIAQELNAHLHDSATSLDDLSHLTDVDSDVDDDLDDGTVAASTLRS